MSKVLNPMRCRVAVIWIDWYPYHVARFRGLDSAPALTGRVAGIELVGGIGVHAGLKFREDLPEDLAIETLMPQTSWRDAARIELSQKLWKRLTDLNPEVVLVPGYYTLPAIIAAAWARLHRRASVLMTESTAGDHRRSWWKERIKALGIHMLFNWTVSGGAAHREYLDQLGFPRDRVRGFYDVVDNAMFAEGTRSLRENSSAAELNLPSRYFLYVGRLAPEKNVAGLLRSWLVYRERGGKWPLMLVGDGPEITSLKKTASLSAFASEVHFPGLRSSRELLPYYAFAGCFVLPSTREPWGLVVNEAMASALPVLVSNRCGCSEDLVVQGLNGFVFDPQNEPRLTAYLQTIEKMSSDDRYLMGLHSAAAISEFSPAHFGASIADIADRQGSASEANKAVSRLSRGTR